jgi:hypothetical protein
MFFKLNFSFFVIINLDPDLDSEYTNMDSYPCCKGIIIRYRLTTYRTVLKTKRIIIKSDRITMMFVQAAGSSLSSTLESVIVAVVQVVATILAALVMDKLGEST